MYYYILYYQSQNQLLSNVPKKSKNKIINNDKKIGSKHEPIKFLFFFTLLYVCRIK